MEPTNAGSGSISGYQIAPDGSLSLLNANGRAGVTGSHPTDMALSVNSRYLYALDTGSNAINIFAIGSDGSLSSLGGVNAPAGSTGLAAW